MTRFITGIPPAARELAGDSIAEDGLVTDEKRALSALSDYVLLYEEPIIISEMCAFLSGNDYEKTAEKAQELLLSSPGLSYRTRKKVIEDELFSCFCENETLNFTGFLHFRLSDYENLLFLGVNAAFGEVIVNREYEKSCLEIKNYVESKKSSVREAHIYAYDVFDENGESMNAKDEELLASDGIFTEGDGLLALLVSLSPQKIFIHIPPDDETLGTVKKIFPFLIYS